MKYIVNWFDCGVCVNSETVSGFTVTEILKGYGIEESASAILLAEMVIGYHVSLTDCGGYDLLMMKAEG